MQFDWTITIGNLLTIGTFFIMGILMILRVERCIEKRLDRIVFKVNLIWEWFKKVHNIPGDADDKT